MRLAGAAMVVAAGLLAGLTAANALRERAARREELVRMLALMEFELGRFCTPLPALFENLTGQLEGPAGDICRAVWGDLGLLGQRPFGEIWTGALAVLPAAERSILLPLGQVLGRYGAEEQLAALCACRQAMERAAAEAQTALQERGRMAVGISAAGAAALAVLLL